MPTGVHPNHQVPHGPKLPVAAAPRRSLAPREREIAHLRCEGLNSKEIAARLGVTTKTVSVHLNNIHHKLGVHSIAQLLLYRTQSIRIESRISILEHLIGIASNSQGSAVWHELFTSLLVQEKRTLETLEDTWPATDPPSIS